MPEKPFTFDLPNWVIRNASNESIPLTPKQTQLVYLIVHGTPGDLKMAAKALDMNPTTAKQHISTVCQKLELPEGPTVNGAGIGSELGPRLFHAVQPDDFSATLRPPQNQPHTDGGENPPVITTGKVQSVSTKEAPTPSPTRIVLSRPVEEQVSLDSHPTTKSITAAIQETLSASTKEGRLKAVNTLATIPIQDLSKAQINSLYLFLNHNLEKIGESQTRNDIKGSLETFKHILNRIQDLKTKDPQKWNELLDTMSEVVHKSGLMPYWLSVSRWTNDQRAT